MFLEVQTTLKSSRVQIRSQGIFLHGHRAVSARRDVLYVQSGVQESRGSVRLGIALGSVVRLRCRIHHNDTSTLHQLLLEKCGSSTLEDVHVSCLEHVH